MRVKLASNEYVLVDPDAKDEKEGAQDSSSKEKKEDEPKKSNETPVAAPEEGSQIVGSSLIEEPKEAADGAPKPILAVALRSHLGNMSKEDNWYELYKSITNEKDMAEKDQQRMIRRERRRIKKK